MFVQRIRNIEDPAITRVSSREVPASRAGLEQEAVEAIWNSILRYYRLGLQPAMTLCLRVRGEVVIDRAVGHAQGNAPEDDDLPLLEATPDTPFNLFSASKPITAMLVHGLVERQVIRLDDTICTYLPEFDQPGKRDITIRHVLSHRAGLPTVPNKIDLDRLGDHRHIRQVLADAPMDNPSGSNSAYHALTGGYILWQLVREVTGQCIKDLQDEWVCNPLGFNLMNYGLPAEFRSSRAPDVFTGPPAFYPFTKIVGRALGVSLKEVVSITNDQRFLDAVVPSANVFATANEACLYFEMLRCGGRLGGQQIFAESTIRQAVAQAAFTEIDSVMKLPVNYGLGFMLGSPMISLFGQRTAGAFGHMGFTNVLVWADPARELSCAFLNNGKPFVTPELIAWFNIPRTIASLLPARQAA